MKIEVKGTNVWASREKCVEYVVYLHTSLEKQPTPVMTRDIRNNVIYSKLQFQIFDEVKEIELKKGNYIMLITKDDWIRDGERACGHMHYFNGKHLVSVYTKEKLNIEDAFCDGNDLLNKLKSLIEESNRI